MFLCPPYFTSVVIKFMFRDRFLHDLPDQINVFGHDLSHAFKMLTQGAMYFPVRRLQEDLPSGERVLPTSYGTASAAYAPKDSSAHFCSPLCICMYCITLGLWVHALYYVLSYSCKFRQSSIMTHWVWLKVCCRVSCL